MLRAVYGFHGGFAFTKIIYNIEVVAASEALFYIYLYVSI